jgi:hypothetical protein
MLRISIALIGGFLGFLMSYGLDKLFPATSYAGTRTLFCIMAAGTALVALGERLRIIPTIASVSEPPSIR